MTCAICGHDEVVKRKRTDPPTEAGTYYAVYVETIPARYSLPTLDGRPGEIVEPERVKRYAPETVYVSKEGDKVGIWDDINQSLGALFGYEWYGPVPELEVIPCGHEVQDGVVKRKRTAPPTEAGTYYAAWWRTYPDYMEKEPVRCTGTIEVSSFGGKVGLWDPKMEDIDPLPEEYEWYGRVPDFEVIP
jgi:hypothetical protein